MTATKWTNGSGWNVTTNAGALRFEVWPSGSIVRLIDDPTSLCGFQGTHYLELGTGTTLPTQPKLVIALCQMLWRDRRDGWTPIAD